MGSNDYQTLVGNMALGKYKYIELQGYEGRNPEKALLIYVYESGNSQQQEILHYFLQEKHRESVKKIAEQHSIVFEELPDRETKTKVQKEFERWFERIVEKGIDEISHYEKAVEFAKELSHGVVRGYWENEIAKLHDIYDLIKMRGGHSEFNVGRERLATYMIKRIGYGSRTGQSYTTQRGWEHYHGNDEASNMDLMISTMVGIGLLKKVDVSNIYELTSEAFALLKKPKWHERYAELLSWVSIVAMFLSIILMLRELGIV